MSGDEIDGGDDLLKSVIASLNEGLVLSDDAGELFHWNPVALALHGFASAEEATGSFTRLGNLFEVTTLDGGGVPLEDWPLARVLRGEVFHDVELRVRRADAGWQRIFRYGGSRVRRRHGGEVAILTINDVTERHRRDELAEENRRMREASRLKSEFLANMSHELRSPLNAIIGFTSLIHAGKTGPISDEQREYLGDVLGSSRHLLSLINDVLDLAKIEAGHVEVDVARVDLANLAREVVDILRPLHEAKSHRVTVTVDDALGGVDVDERMTKQILFNYVSNAIKFTPAGGTIGVRVESCDETTFRIVVEDSGIGIAPRDMSRLFVEFQQLDAGLDKSFPGTGLGLAVTRRLAEAQGGRVGATSTHGEGSRFEVVLPRAVVPMA